MKSTQATPFQTGLALANGVVLALASVWAAPDVAALMEPDQRASLYGIDETRRLVFTQVAYTAYVLGLVTIVLLHFLSLRIPRFRQRAIKAQIAFGCAFLLLDAMPQSSDVRGMIYNTDKNWLYENGVMIGVLPAGTPYAFLVVGAVGIAMHYATRRARLAPDH